MAAPQRHGAAEPSQRRSLLSLSPGFVILAVAVANATRFADADLWGHVRYGQAMLAAGHLIHHDPYSYSAPGHLWRNHEWLTEVVFALLYNHLGIAGLDLIKLCSAAVTVVLLAVAVADTGAVLSIQRMVVLVAAAALAPQMQFRPQLFTFMALAALLALMARRSYRGRSPLWLVVPILALWSNLHGGFIVGIAALAIYGGVFTLAHVGEAGVWKRAGWFAAMVAAAGLATLANPYGVGAWLAVARALHNPFTRHVVTDWQPMIPVIARQWNSFKPGVLVYVPFFLMLARLVMALARAPRSEDLEMLAVALVFVIAAFVSARNLALAVIAMAAPLASHWNSSSAARRESVAEQPEPRQPAGEAETPLKTALACALAISLAAFCGLFSRVLRAPGGYPTGAIRFMQARRLHGNLLNDFDWGEYLIWHVTPASKVFIDGRYDTVYPDSVIEDYLAFYFEPDGARRVLDAYPHDFALIRPGSSSYRILSADRDWRLLYLDRESALFGRKNARPELGAAHIERSAPETRFP